MYAVASMFTSIFEPDVLVNLFQVGIGKSPLAGAPERGRSRALI
jgi:hypothetical protein